MQTLLTLVLAALTLLAVSIQRTYSKVPLKELKHRARHGDELAAAIVKVVGYGQSLQAVLWFLIGLTSAGFFVMVSMTTPVWVALASSLALVWVGFAILPVAQVTSIGEHLAAWCAPILTKIIAFLHPVIDWFSGL